MNNEHIEFQQDTEQLRELIAQVDSSGLAAFDAGVILSKVKSVRSYRNDYKTFEDYTQTAFSINPQTANTYISISQKFNREEIGNLTLVTHLKTIAEIDNSKLRKTVLGEFRKIEEENGENPPVFGLKEVIATVSILSSEGNEASIEQVQGVIETVIEKSKQEKRRKKAADKKQKGSNSKDLFGEQFKSEYFKEVSVYLENEPINEMGVVALFCLMFISIRMRQFEWKGEKISFQSIKFVRAGFPDACVRCKRMEGKKSITFEMNIEFQFLSYDYIRDGHTKSPKAKDCDMIVCWEDNAKSDPKFKNNQTVKDLPPVLALKNCFETGEIELIH